MNNGGTKKKYDGENFGLQASYIIRLYINVCGLIKLFILMSFALVL